MPGRFLTENERERRRRFPLEIPPGDVTDYFLLSETDRRRVNRQRGDPNRLGFALQLCTLRYLGFVPEELPAASSIVVTSLAEQLNIGREQWQAYGHRRGRIAPRGAARAQVPRSAARSVPVSGWAA